ncbi:MAG TPA: division/cell wall cluster transcriptional repressor MraZ [Candidatus Avilachnospira avistercoris]|nr:division/cell wall cluster transcriptional repressor MraZ [Candidatus Avilachnospira avistercoris]
MLMGEYNHIIDAKGRLIIPAKFREELGDSFVVTRGLGSCLSIYPEAAWERMIEKVRELPVTDKRGRDFKRYIVSGAADCELDKMGRILLPQPLRNFAGLNKEVVLVGQIDFIEIWDRDKWDVVQKGFEEPGELENVWEGLGI